MSDEPVIWGVFGPPSSGKTTTCLEAVKVLNRSGGRWVYIDNDVAFTPQCRVGLRDLLSEVSGNEWDIDGADFAAKVNNLFRIALLDLVYFTARQGSHVLFSAPYEKLFMTYGEITGLASLEKAFDPIPFRALYMVYDSEDPDADDAVINSRLEARAAKEPIYYRKDASKFASQKWYRDRLADTKRSIEAYDLPWINTSAPVEDAVDKLVRIVSTPT